MLNGVAPLLTLLFIVLLTSTSANVPQKTASTQQSVDAAEDRWLIALYSSNASALSRIMGTDFDMVYLTQRIDRTQFLKAFAERGKTLAPSATGVAAPQVSNRKHQFLSDGVVILSDVCTSPQKGEGTSQFSGTYWQTEVWQREGAEWKMIHYHVSPVQGIQE